MVVWAEVVGGGFGGRGDDVGRKRKQKKPRPRAGYDEGNPGELPLQRRGAGMAACRAAKVAGTTVPRARALIASAAHRALRTAAPTLLLLLLLLLLLPFLLLFPGRRWRRWRGRRAGEPRRHRSRRPEIYRDARANMEAADAAAAAGRRRRREAAPGEPHHPKYRGQILQSAYTRCCASFVAKPVAIGGGEGATDSE